jgi:hypothetical protein
VSKAERGREGEQKVRKVAVEYNNPSKPWISMGKKASAVIDLFSEIICVGGDGLVDGWVGGWMGWVWARNKEGRAKGKGKGEGGGRRDEAESQSAIRTLVMVTLTLTLMSYLQNSYYQSA